MANNSEEEARALRETWTTYFAGAEVASDYTGLTLDAAKALANTRKIERVRAIDVTKPATVTDDYQRERLNLLVDGNRVVYACKA